MAAGSTTSRCEVAHCGIGGVHQLTRFPEQSLISVKVERNTICGLSITPIKRIEVDI